MRTRLGSHVGDGLERLNGEASGHAADELVASDGPDGIARGFRLLDGQRELEAPFEHHLEDDIHIGAIGLDHVEEELTGSGFSMPDSSSSNTRKPMSGSCLGPSPSLS